MTDTTLKLTEAGSSPLARGTQKELRQAITFPGLIPARAGNTDTTRRYLLGLRAHPRSRGEHRKPAMTKSTPPGSSPLARGTPVRASAVLVSMGLIPARAGNTLHRYRGTGRTGAHPRSRGEHSHTVCGVVEAVGSSPLARGTHGPRGPSTSAAGLIPARAGNTDPAFKQRRLRGAHPRSRGEHEGRARTSEAREGSSPLARGTHGIV